jgi:uncharacterized membrane protein YhiD involved in acid resistance
MAENTVSPNVKSNTVSTDIESLVSSSYLYPDPVALDQFVINLLITFIIVYVVAIFYRTWGVSISDRTAFSKNFVLLGLTTFLIISIVKSSLALSLGLIGALSIVRFRAAIKEPEELVYLFLVIGIGLGLGANQRGPTIIAAFCILSLVYFTGRTKSQVNTDSLHRLSIVAPKSSSITLEEITDILREIDIDSSIKRYSQTDHGLEVMFVLKIPDVNALSTSCKRLTSLDSALEINVLDARPII